MTHGGGDVYDNLSDARAVYAAERHDEPADHAVQMAVLAALHQRDPSVGLGMEMFLRSQQPVLDDYVAGRIDEAELRERTDWDRTWGFDYGLYRPLLEFCRQHRLPVYGLNVRSELSQAVARGGVQSLTPDQRAEIPSLDLSRADHRAWIREIMGFGPESPDGEAAQAHGGPGTPASG